MTTKLNIGCQHVKKVGFVNVDLDPLTGPDVVADALHLPYESNTIDYIESTHCIEHTTSFDMFNREMYRVLKMNKLIKITMPYAYGRLSLSSDHILHIKAHNFYKYEVGNKHKSLNPNVTWEVVTISYRHCYPLYLVPLWLVGSVVEGLLNRFGRRFRELYECHWGWMFPMQEFTITMVKK